ncbi:MAG: endoglucanase, partial [Acidobacteriota bacterium]
AVARESVEAWMGFLRRHALSHLNWSIADKDEGASVLRPGSSPTGGWGTGDLTGSGQFVREIVRGWPSEASAGSTSETAGGS